MLNLKIVEIESNKILRNLRVLFLQKFVGLIVILSNKLYSVNLTNYFNHVSENSSKSEKQENNWNAVKYFIL